MSLGIPYASWNLETMKRICPVCSLEIAEDTDPTGELETNNYGEHYAKEHAEDE